MPVNDLGYRPWEGKRQYGLGLWWVIAETGIRLAWKSYWLRRMLLVAWIPAAALGVVLFFYEQQMNDPAMAPAAAQALRALPNFQAIEPALMQPNQAPWVTEEMLGDQESRRRTPGHTASERHRTWAFILLTLFRYPQAVLMVMLVGLIGPSLIARDMRSRAFLLYFSRPIECIDYVIGKAAVVWVYLALITTLPAMALYVLGVFLSPELSVVQDTWDLPLRILAASVCLIIPTTFMALCFSSLTLESRYASFAWFSLWILGWVAYANLTGAQIFVEGGEMNANAWTLVSLYHSLGRVQSWVFGLETDVTQIILPFFLLVILTLISLSILLRRVVAPLRI